MKRDWKPRLRELVEAEVALASVVDAKTPLPDRAELESAVADLGRLWAAPTTSERDRKRLLRTLIGDITLRSEPGGSELRIGVRWHSGATEEIVTERVTQLCEARRTAPAAVALVRELGPTTDNATLADKLNAGSRHRDGASL